MGVKKIISSDFFNVSGSRRPDWIGPARSPTSSHAAIAIGSTRCVLASTLR